MKKTVVLFALLAWTLLAGQDRATSVTSNLLNANGEAYRGQGTGPMPMCPPDGCPTVL